jgi:hypothetical protein
MAIEMFAEMLKKLQNSTWLIPKNRSFSNNDQSTSQPNYQPA